MTVPPNTPRDVRGKGWPVVVAALGVGFGVGFLTRLGQQHLPDVLGSLADSAGPWTLLALGVSLLTRRLGLAVAAAGLTLLALLVGYAVSAQLAGYATSARTTVFWVLCAAIVGPIVAWLGWWGRRDRRLGRSLAVAGLAGLLVGEGVYGLTVVAGTTSPTYWSAEIVVGALGLLALGVVRRPSPQAGLAVAGALVVAGVFVLLYRLPLVGLL